MNRSAVAGQRVTTYAAHRFNALQQPSLLQVIAAAAKQTPPTIITRLNATVDALGSGTLCSTPAGL
jgi:hypothetical protein